MSGRRRCQMIDTMFHRHKHMAFQHTHLRKHPSSKMYFKTAMNRLTRQSCWEICQGCKPHSLSWEPVVKLLAMAGHSKRWWSYFYRWWSKTYGLTTKDSPGKRKFCSNQKRRRNEIPSWKHNNKTNHIRAVTPVKMQTGNSRRLLAN